MRRLLIVDADMDDYGHLSSPSVMKELSLEDIEYLVKTRLEEDGYGGIKLSVRNVYVYEINREVR